MLALEQHLQAASLLPKTWLKSQVRCLRHPFNYCRMLRLEMVTNISCQLTEDTSGGISGSLQQLNEDLRSD